MLRTPIAIGLMMAVCVALGCASIDPAPQTAAGPASEVPSAWLDLPDSPLAVSHIGPRAVLVNRAGEDISTIAVGCVQESNGLVAVAGSLWTQDVKDGESAYGQRVTGILKDIFRLYRDSRRCSAGTYASITQASFRKRTDFKWSAAGTPWPKGPPQDTRNTWRVSARTPPAFEYVDSFGCFDVDVSTVNRAMTEVLSVRLELNRKKLPTARRPRVVKLADRSASDQVQIEVYQTKRHDWLCSDVSWWDSEQPTTWLPRRGTLTVWAEPRGKDFDEYPVTIRLTDAEFIGPGGASIRPPQAIVIKTLAGGMAGGDSVIRR